MIGRASAGSLGGTAAWRCSFSLRRWRRRDIRTAYSNDETALHLGASASPLLLRSVVSVRSEAAGLSECLELDPAADAPVELDQALQRQERLTVVLAAQRGEHAGVVVERGDRGAQAAPERLKAGPATKVLVAAGAGRLGHDLELAGIGLQLEHRLAGEGAP